MSRGAYVREGNRPGAKVGGGGGQMSGNPIF